VNLRARSALVYNLLLAAIGLLLLGIVTWQQQPAAVQIELLISTILFVAVLAIFPLSILQDIEITLIQIVTLGNGILYGQVLAGWTTTLGILIGYIFLIIWPRERFPASTSPQERILKTSRELGLQLIPLVLALNLYPILRSGSIVNPQATIFIQTLLFGLIHGALVLLDRVLQGKTWALPVWQNGGSLALFELIPFPFVLLANIAFPVSQVGVIIAVGGLPVLLAILLQGTTLTRRNLERRLQDLSTLQHVSQALRLSVKIENLLPVIQQQVTELLEVNNFYVALFDRNEEKIWYPLAVKHGERMDWPRRELTDRLTDRVIRDQRSILLARDARQELDRIGLPPSEDAPHAWLGVPLITAERTIGCLAVFSTSPDVSFNAADKDLLNILSGQVSVAIENALLFEKAERRASQLENLNRISTLITASLDPQEVFAQVCRSVNQVGGGRRSSIYLIDSEQRLVRLAYAQGLSDEFTHTNGTFPNTDEQRTLCLRTGKPVLVPDIGLLSQFSPFLESLIQEDIRGYGDFPLITPQGQIGFLSVYFSQATELKQEQVEVLQTFASQAAVAVANARLYSQTDMALTRRAHQLAILENIGRELSAAIHSEHLFEMILDYALDFTNSPWGSLKLSTPADHRIDIMASRGYQEMKKSYPDSQGVAARVIQTRKAINLGDVTTEPDRIDLTGGAAQSLLAVPLLHEGGVLGVLTLESPRLNAFTENDQVFMSQLATQAAIAVVNAALYRETRQRLHDQASLYEVSKLIGRNLRLDNILETVVRAIDEVLDGRETGIYLWDSGAHAYNLKAATSRDYPEGQHLPAFIDETEFSASKPDRLGTGMLHMAARAGESSQIFSNCSTCQVLIFQLELGSERLGMVVSHLAQDIPVLEKDMQLPRSIATQGAIAIQNALLFADIAKGRDRLEAVLNSVQEGVLMVNAQGKITLGNASSERITGVALEDIVNKRLTDLPSKALKYLGLTQDKASKLMESLGQEHWLLPPKMTVKEQSEKIEKVVDRFIAPVWGQGRQTIGWVFVLRDVSEEHQLTRAREMITETLVHDLRSPMSAVSSALSLLDEALARETQDPLTEQSLDIAKRSTRRVLSLIESLLDISRMEAGIVTLERTQFSLFNMTKDIISEFIPQANELGLVLRNEIAPTTPQVHADPEKITRVLTNLLDNAIKFTPEGGQVTLSTAPLDGQTLIVQVTDTGPGIPLEYREKIFDRFTQVPGFRGRRRGSGIGLTFCKLAVEAHGGRIWVEPRPGEGSIFSFTLPRADII
jgi:signal transduction histidine kinase/signal transduction protein with GAF and PtsI domain